MNASEDYHIYMGMLVGAYGLLSMVLIFSIINSYMVYHFQVLFCV